MAIDNSPRFTSLLSPLPPPNPVEFKEQKAEEPAFIPPGLIPMPQADTHSSAANGKKRKIEVLNLLSSEMRRSEESEKTLMESNRKLGEDFAAAQDQIRKLEKELAAAQSNIINLEFSSKTHQLNSAFWIAEVKKILVVISLLKAQRIIDIHSISNLSRIIFSLTQNFTPPPLSAPSEISPLLLPMNANAQVSHSSSAILPLLEALNSNTQAVSDPTKAGPR